ncbi:MAG TPA: histidine triad nucleotide-binding protein [Candidatus Baltobacteraceae bacterium]|jgi:histidine triad (HIT) family protein|nr:histidine triad nucleotide-binding protein [Candidatus Baltobacteraceae bacterium]
MKTMTDCIFCKIVCGEIPATEVARSKRVVAFRDVNPQAPSHLVVVPTRHVADLGSFAEIADDGEIAELLRTAAQLGRRVGPGGYRVVANEGADGGQTVFHLHLHVLAGRHLTWPPG